METSYAVCPFLCYAEPLWYRARLIVCSGYPVKMKVMGSANVVRRATRPAAALQRSLTALSCAPVSHCGSPAARSRVLLPVTPRQARPGSASHPAACLLLHGRTASRPVRGGGGVRWPPPPRGCIPDGTVAK